MYPYTCACSYSHVREWYAIGRISSRQGRQTYKYILYTLYCVYVWKGGTLVWVFWGASYYHSGECLLCLAPVSGLS